MRVLEEAQKILEDSDEDDWVKKYYRDCKEYAEICALEYDFFFPKNKQEVWIISLRSGKE